MNTIEKTKQIILQLQMDYMRLARNDFNIGIPMRNNWITVMLYIEKSGISDYELNYLNNLEKEQWDELGFTLTTLLQYLYNAYASEYEKLTLLNNS